MSKPTASSKCSCIGFAVVVSLHVLAPVAAAGQGAPSHAPDEPVNAVEVVAVGDLAQCGQAKPGESPTARVAQLVAGGSLPILMVGDLAYSDGTREDFMRCFDPVWGRFKPRILPVPGNHEYRGQASPYFYDYFSDSVPDLRQGYYARQIGAWRVIALNSSQPVAPGSPQALWLKQELAEHTNRCTLAFWHHPRFSSGKHGNAAAMDATWRALQQAGVDIVVAGHDHNYERFAPQDADGRADNATGILEFVVGTGGAKLRRFGEIALNSEVRNAETFGVLRLTLADGSYSWRFQPTEGASFADQGNGTCH